MNIHHAVVKSAASKGVTLELVDEEHVMATERGLSFVFPIENEAECTEAAREAWDAVTNALAFMADHPGIRIEQTEEGDFIGYAWDPEIGQRVPEVEALARDPVLEDLFETLATVDEDAEPESEDEDEDEATGSVVPAKYKAIYAERGNPNHCGDWLAETLARFCRVLDDKGKEVTDLDRLETIAAANDVKPERYGKLGLATNGWQGRFRMTVRNMLTKVVAAKGHLFVPEGCGVDADTELAAPRQWCLEHSPKPKPVKAPKPEAATTKDPGAGKASAKTKAKKDPLAGVKAATDAVRASRAKASA